MNQDFRDLLQIFSDTSVRYLIIGGYAVIKHSEPRYTKDLDVSAMLLGGGTRFSCLYQRSVRPKSEWNQLWNTLLSKGLNEIQDGQRNLMLEDGDGFDVEINYLGKLRRFSVPHPDSQRSSDAKQILDISDLISREFNTPVFVADYDRGKVGEYLIDLCKDFKVIKE